jgi:tRNA G18 (ribose-2'-O)-methylase SpoU
MFELSFVQSIDPPELAPYRTLRRQTDHRREGIFVAEGPKVVERLLQSPFGVVSLLISDNWLDALRPLLEARPERIPVYVAPRLLLNELTGFHLFQGVLAIGRILPPVALDQLLRAAAGPPLLVAAEQLTSAENMGMLVRNCAGFGATALIVGETCVSPYLRRAVRNSMGTIFKLPIVETNDLHETLRDLAARGIDCIAAHPHADQKFLPDCDLARGCCIVLGSEGHGLSKGALAACRQTAAIPMANGVDSLNVGNAGAVFLYEAHRQRRRPA